MKTTRCGDCRRPISDDELRRHGRLCRKCKEARYKAAHPYAYSLNKLRNNAKRRGIAFDLTLEEWIMFCDLTGYVHACGRGADSLSVDRIDASKGYSLDNIRAVTLAENTRVAWVNRKIRQWIERRQILVKYPSAA